MKFILSALSLLTLQLVSGQNQYASRATLYEGFNQQGNYLVIPQTYAPNLSLNGFDNLANSVCVTGMWIFYVNYLFNAQPSGVEYVFGPNNFCTNFATVGGYVSSARFAGSPNDYRSDSFTLYQYDYFQGEEEYTYADLPTLQLSGNHQSIIITGASAWTIFDQPNYQGNSICLFPEPSSDYKPYIISDTSSISVPHGSIKSVRKGCVGKQQEVHGDNNVAHLARFGKA